MIGNEIVDAARSRIGSPFRHHFKPNNLCDYGAVTVASCMERGMDTRGYDCSGLIIASICEAVGLDTSIWPAELRHLNQMKDLESELEPTPGDVLLFYQKVPRTHMGIFVTKNTVIHASGISKIVEEGAVEGEILRVGIIPSQNLLEKLG